MTSETFSDQQKREPRYDSSRYSNRVGQCFGSGVQDSERKRQLFTGHSCDKTTFGAREAGRALIKHQGKVVAHVSFNGRVWQGKDYVAGATPLFEPKGDL